MKRRDFLRSLAVSVPTLCMGCSHLLHRSTRPAVDAAATEPLLDDIGAGPSVSNGPKTEAQQSNDVRAKSERFDDDFADDVFCPAEQRELVRRMVAKFRAVQRHVGNGNFNLLGMDEFFRHGEVTSAEKAFLDQLFHFEAHRLGFYGPRVFASLTDTINRNNTVKVPHSGHFLRKGRSLELYERIIRDAGRSLILTSGVRGLAKQFHLFLEKTELSDGNYSKASRSLAPPGYSFHGRNDFDIGKVGFGAGNFTDEFAKTDEFKRLCDLGYVDIRYKEKNSLGVRFEPWHIQISEG